MGHFDDETSVVARGDGCWHTRLSAAWNIGENANGGYALSSVIRAEQLTSAHPDPISVTAHFLRPCAGDTDAEIAVETVRTGRAVTTLTGSLTQGGVRRVASIGAWGTLQSGGTDVGWALPPPNLPPPEQCCHRSGLEQGVELPIVGRADVFVHPDHAQAGASERPLLEGWVRFSDESAPTTSSLPFFADAFPPALYAAVARIGWVPTIELTVHCRRRPVEGWIRGRFECLDVVGDTMVESGTLWDDSGAVVAHSRQLGLVLDR